jgi:hypothetical protein
MAKGLTLLGYIIRTWLFWMSGAFSLLLTTIVLVRSASGSPVSPNQTLVILGCLGVIAFLLSGVAAWRYEYRRANKFQARLNALEGQVAKDASLRDNLAALMLEGQDLHHRLASTDEPLETLEPEIATWAMKTETWLGQNLGSSHIVRFRNSAGIPMGAYVMRRALNTKEGPLNGFMRVRLARLGEFIAEQS